MLVDSMPRETLNTRVTRLENVMVALAERQLEMESTMASLAGKVDVLVDAQIKNEQRFDQLGERIDKLVSAIGEWIRRSNGAR